MYKNNMDTVLLQAIPIQYVKMFFYEAMTAGYASDGKTTEIEGLPGHKMFSYGEEDSFRLTDIWCGSSYGKHGASSGSTVIYYEGLPIWSMVYSGYHEEMAIPTLKTALLKAYEGKLFFGGRGPQAFFSEYLEHPQGFVYTNEYIPEDHKNGFIRFHGSEKIVMLSENHSTRLVGLYNYSGGIL